jgi:hypothetical protein
MSEGEKIVALARGDLERELRFDDRLEELLEWYAEGETASVLERVRLMAEIPAASLTDEEKRLIMELVYSRQAVVRRRYGVMEE